MTLRRRKRERHSSAFSTPSTIAQCRPQDGSKEIERGEGGVGSVTRAILPRCSLFLFSCFSILPFACSESFLSMQGPGQEGLRAGGWENRE